MKVAGYDETIELLQTVFPGRGAIDAKECADFLGSDLRSIYDSFERVNNPLPSLLVGKRKRVIPLPALARWL